MGNGGTKENQNVYFRARKQAAMYNERLSSREGAAEMLGISPSTLADYELGITKFVPVDKVVLMADLYNCPELRIANMNVLSGSIFQPEHEVSVRSNMTSCTEDASASTVLSLRLICVSKKCQS